MRAAALQLQPVVPSDAKRRIREFLRGFSVEASSLDDLTMTGLRAALPGGTKVYLPAIPGRGFEGTVRAATRLQAFGFEPVPHLAARSLASRHALDELLAQLAGEAGVGRILAIAGDLDRPLGPFEGALDLIECGLLQRHGIAEVGVAGYPEGHPRIAPDALGRSLAAKLDAAEQTGLHVHIVTQFGFDVAAIETWLRRLRDLGIENPVRIGLAGPASLTALLRYAARCGVRASAQGLTRHAGLVKHFIGWSAPDALVRALAEAAVHDGLGRVAAHFYSFGGAAATARWVGAAAAGRFSLDRTDGFRVEPP